MGKSLWFFIQKNKIKTEINLLLQVLFSIIPFCLKCHVIGQKYLYVIQILIQSMPCCTFIKIKIPSIATHKTGSLTTNPPLPLQHYMEPHSKKFLCLYVLVVFLLHALTISNRHVCFLLVNSVKLFMALNSNRVKPWNSIIASTLQHFLEMETEFSSLQRKHKTRDLERQCSFLQMIFTQCKAEVTSRHCNWLVMYKAMI